MTPRSVIIDCDPGIDDAIALLMAFGSPEISVNGITVVSGNVPLECSVRNALQICELAGRRDVGVHAGCFRPLVRDPIRGQFSGRTGLGNLRLPEPGMKAAGQHSVPFIIESAMRARAKGEPITICALGPLTNLGTALRMRPELVDGIDRLIMMGGAYREPGNRTPAAEFNILVDPHAAHIVFSSGLPITAVGLDASHQALSTPDRVAAIAATGGPVCSVVAELLRFWDRSDVDRFAGPGGPLHDPLVIAQLLHPELFETRRARVFVEHDSPLTLGQTVTDWFGQSGMEANVDVVTKVEGDVFYSVLAERLTRLGAGTAA